ncbi:hypothetical protein [Actinokineospora enzanensis]|uniref:hypothetical protein n=1 Tax=Actinokineospora enzanensis TaxID=155975 RepID=UPI00036D3EF4|nr:hypothetical protein [Actinokineospora enzanensis]
MPWYAQRKGLPETHWMWVDPGTELERAYVAIGYVVVRVDVVSVDEPPVDAAPAPTKRRR